jgi:hypothetical protein
MDPVRFEPEQLHYLPPHRVITLAKDQPPFRPLEVVVGPPPRYRMISQWQLTDNDRIAIAAGANIFIEQLTYGKPFQAILPTVGLRDFCPMDEF